jgi:hypothetical protein
LQSRKPCHCYNDEVSAVDNGAVKDKDRDPGRSWRSSLLEDELVDEADEFEDALAEELLRTGVIEVWPGG